MDKLTCEEIYKDFCDWSPDYASMIVSYRSWGSSSIIVWLTNGKMYKCKRRAKDWFTMQIMSYEDIKKYEGKV